jgi:hypothetical protein
MDKRKEIDAMVERLAMTYKDYVVAGGTLTEEDLNVWTACNQWWARQAGVTARQEQTALHQVNTERAPG